MAVEDKPRKLESRSGRFDNRVAACPRIGTDTGYRRLHRLGWAVLGMAARALLVTLVLAARATAADASGLALVDGMADRQIAKSFAMAVATDASAVG